MVSVSACFSGRMPSVHCFLFISHPALIYAPSFPVLFTVATVLRSDWRGYLAAQLTGNVVFTFQEEIQATTHTVACVVFCVSQVHHFTQREEKNVIARMLHLDVSLSIELVLDVSHDNRNK